jgi:hypothetical protein
MQRRGEQKMKRPKVFVSVAIFILLLATPTLPISNQTRTSAEAVTSSGSTQNEAFKPIVFKPAWADTDDNGIVDTLDREIADRIANDTVQDYVNVLVMLKTAPTTQDADAFILSSGHLTTKLWSHATYGFGGTIPYDKIENFIRLCPDVLLVEKDAPLKAYVAYAAQQVGARTYVWNTLNLQGDPNSSTAIIDSGIDASHADFSPGYGDQDFSKKIVGWNDQLDFTTSPIDDYGHGSHCSGLAAGAGFFSTNSSSGNAQATWYANYTSQDVDWMTTAGMMVNKTGLITINVDWTTTGTINLSGIWLSNTANLRNWDTVASVNTPNPWTTYSLTYNVTSLPSRGYDIFQVFRNQTGGTGILSVVIRIYWPYTPPPDDFPAWTGIAPQSKLVGVRVIDASYRGNASTLSEGIDWIVEHKQAYHITVASMSVGFTEENWQVDIDVMNLVSSGVCTVVAAGNDGSGNNNIYTPASVGFVTTVAAMNQFDNVSWYSSQGGPSRWDQGVTKPDLTAPGGGYAVLPIFSAETNYKELGGVWLEILPNDARPAMGTSMSAPIIAGCTQVVVQAMGGYSSWNWTRSQALQPKMILLMTATETYPNFREGEGSATSPSLDRGGKDVHEGYGRVNLDAAVDAVLKTYKIDTVVSDTLGSPPTFNNISVLGQRLVWARNIQLVLGCKYNFSLSVPTGADYDLYLYNSTGDFWGEPVIVGKSTNASTGGTEQFWVTAPYTGTYYVVVKRATETTGSGTFTLSVRAVPLCALKTKTDGVSWLFYVPNATFVNATALKVELLFNDSKIVGDQTGNNTHPYPEIATYPDGRVTAPDVTLVSSKFGLREGQTGWDYMADVWPSRKIDAKDVGAVSGNFGNNGTYTYWDQGLSGVKVVFDTGDQELPDTSGFVPIPLTATNFNVTRNDVPIGAMVIFFGP